MEDEIVTETHWPLGLLLPRVPVNTGLIYDLAALGAGNPGGRSERVPLCVRGPPAGPAPGAVGPPGPAVGPGCGASGARPRAAPPVTTVRLFREGDGCANTCGIIVLTACVRGAGVRVLGPSPASAARAGPGGEASPETGHSHPTPRPRAAPDHQFARGGRAWRRLQTELGGPQCVTGN